MNVFDASALLAFAAGEVGADDVEAALEEDEAVCGAANWSEVAQKVRAHDRDWTLVRALLVSYGLRIEPVTEADAEAAAMLWERGAGLSLADRLCLAQAHRLDATVWTADRAWGDRPGVRYIR